MEQYGILDEKLIFWKHTILDSSLIPSLFDCVAWHKLLTLSDVRAILTLLLRS